MHALIYYQMEMRASICWVLSIINRSSQLQDIFYSNLFWCKNTFPYVHTYPVCTDLSTCNKCSSSVYIILLYIKCFTNRVFTRQLRKGCTEQEEILQAIFVHFKYMWYLCLCVMYDIGQKTNSTCFGLKRKPFKSSAEVILQISFEWKYV